jgi:4-amino-4-deoxy-L-arabinose transferase-like glycosyltransferase
MQTQSEQEEGSGRSWLWAVVVAALIRVPVAFIADDQWGDAPIRFDLVTRWIRDPGIWWSFDKVFQYGPLPTHLTGLLALTGFGPHVASRVVVVLGGVAGVYLLSKLAARFGGTRAGLAAGLALALSPLHIQASTTYTSEALYLAFALACLWRAFERDIWGCAAFAFLASTTRYDTWIWLPLLGLWWLWQGLPQQRAKAFLGAALLGLGPLTILVANGVALELPFAPLNYINKDHITLATDAQARSGPFLAGLDWELRSSFGWAVMGDQPARFGVIAWRIAMAVFWPSALIAVLTPGFAWVAVTSLVKQIRERAQTLLPAMLGSVPPALYTFKSVVLGNFWPMARFALGPSALIAIGMKGISRRTLAICVALSVGYNVTLIALADGQPGIGLFAAAASPVSLLPKDLREGARALREAKGVAALDFVPTYDDILVAHAAGRLAERHQLLHPPEGSVPQRIIGIVGGDLHKALHESQTAFGHSYRKVGELGRVSWWDLAE